MMVMAVVVVVSLHVATETIELLEAIATPTLQRLNG